ncbi:MAG: SDR family NAD(P)-dependent oxidoreductase [Clostridiales bacterium]|nr:SDR family NAD(P)-dependent oxidoreductase [Clostridiales bacterium]
MGKAALVSGASRGIGNAVAKKLAEAGYDLYLTCRQSEERLTEVKKELERNYSIRCVAYTCNMGDYEAVRSLFKEIPDLDVLVNNAGISYVGLLSEMEVSEWQEIMDTNLNSVFYTCKLAIPLMLKKKSGRIVNISSVWGNVGASMEAAYSASKGGVNSLTKALAKELAPSHICVNAVACGVIDTDMNRCFDEEEREALREEIPADRFGRPEEVAELVMQIIDAPEYMTGQIITMDGGWC